MSKQQRRFVCLVGISLVLGACQRRPILPTPTPIDPNRSATLSEAINVVEARDADAPGFLAASVGRVVTTGGEVRTGDNSKARLDLNDASIVRLAQNSAFTVTGLPASGSANPVTQLKLTIGKIWVSLTGGTLEVETPVGVATVRGSFAVFEYVAGDPNDPNDDILIVSCLEGNCNASNQSVNESLGNLEQIILTNGGQTVVRFNLSEADVQAFLQDNPEAARLVATLTAAAPGPTNTARATATNTTSPITQTTITSTPTPTPSRTLTAPPSPTGPAFVILGRHVVQSGETLLCVARGYGVLPNAIALANGLVSPFTLIPGQALGIPAVQWLNISPGPVCPPQFSSPYPGLPTATFTSSPVATASTPTATPTVPTNTPAPVTSTFTPIPASPTLTSTPSVTPSPSLSPTPTNTPTITPTPDTIPPAVSRFSASPTFADQGQGTCQVTFSALVDDLGTVASAMVEWTAYDFLATPTPTGTGSVPMALASGTTTSGTWQVSFTVQIPPYGSLQWNVRATDLGRNAVVQPSGVNIVSGTGGCP